MSSEETEKKKQVIGQYGEFQLAMVLHTKGWQVHRSFIDEGIDFVITKYWCEHCRQTSNQLIKTSTYKNRKRKVVTNLCEQCEKQDLIILSRYLQVKTSEGVACNANPDIRNFSFHPKIRYILGDDIFYVWIAVFIDNTEGQESSTALLHFYIFNTKDVIKFDNLDLPTYQDTDNQKIVLRINRDGEVLNQSKRVNFNYNCFKDFYNNFNSLDF